MKSREGKTVCGSDTTPLDKRTGRPARVWYRSQCHRVVKIEGERCWQHRVGS